ncbi:uncharacterized protein LOC129892665 [Solanum dulcamara]|uniref:uncharacterized protein LOC129892665 n=1 Tax=Solanum dulcamara TaxID=45834 RepID=UPI0024868BEF|nr:uncharacterized protein LOC129892665 [Solanum dulcamara]
MEFIQEKLLAAQSRQKEYADRKVRNMKFIKEEKVSLKVSLIKGVVKFGKRDKLSSSYIRPFEVLKRVGEVTYKLYLPPGTFSYFRQRGCKLRSKEIVSVKVQWKIVYVKVHWKIRRVEESTWETEADMRGRYPHIFVESAHSKPDHIHLLPRKASASSGSTFA